MTINIETYQVKDGTSGRLYNYTFVSVRIAGYTYEGLETVSGYSKLCTSSQDAFAWLAGF